MNAHDDPWAALGGAVPLDEDVAPDRPARRDAPASVAHPSEAILVIGACGGCGTSTVASGMALAIAGHRGTANLVDLDLAWGDLHGSWGLRRDRTLQDLAAVRHELTPDQIGMVLAHHPSGVRLALSPGRPDAGHDWDADTVARLLGGLANGGPTIVDTGRADPDMVIGAGTAATRRLIVSPSSVRGARGAGQIMDALGRDVEVVVNEALHSADLGIRGFRRLLGCPVRAVLPRRPGEAEWLLAGRLPRGRRRPLRDAIRALVTGGAS